MSGPKEPVSSDDQRSIAPPPLDHLVAAFAAEPSDPEVGQVWRARWDAVAQVVLLVAVADDEVDAVPVTPDVDLVDETGVVLGEDATPLRFPSAVWVGLATRVPVRVLDVLLGSIDDDVLSTVRSGRGVGAPISSVLDERAQLRDATADRMSALASASWVPASLGPVDLEAAMRERGLLPGTVATKLGLEPGFVIDMVRGDRSPTPAIADELAVLLDLDPAVLTVVSVDEQLVRVLDRPRYRRRLAEKGRENGIIDEGLWRYQVATQELATAARTTGHGNPQRRWQGLVEDYLR